MIVARVRRMLVARARTIVQNVRTAAYPPFPG